MYGPCFALLLSLMSFSAFAGDVKPGEKLGSLVVTAPSGFVLNNANVSFKIDGVDSIVRLGVESKVAAGSGCIEVKYDQKYKYEASQCGIVIKEKATTTVELAALKLSWDPQAFDVDFGPIPDFVFSTSDTDRKIQGSFKPYGIASNSVAFLLPTMLVNMDFSHSHTGVLNKQNIRLSDGGITDLQLQLPELRATVQVHFVDGAPTFETPLFLKGNFAAVYLSEPNYYHSGYTQIAPNIRTGAAGRGGRYDGNWEERDWHTFNHYKFSEKGVDQELKVFPVTPSKDYQYVALAISINEITVPLNLTPGQTLKFSVATLNVYDYKSNMPGEFELFADRDKLSKILERVPFPYLATHAQSGDVRVPTQRSIFVPYGFKYRLDFYAKDELGRVTLQDQILQDLTIAP